MDAFFSEVSHFLLILSLYIHRLKYTEGNATLLGLMNILRTDGLMKNGGRQPSEVGKKDESRWMSRQREQKNGVTDKESDGATDRKNTLILGQGHKENESDNQGRIG